MSRHPVQPLVTDEDGKVLLKVEGLDEVTALLRSIDRKLDKSYKPKRVELTNLELEHVLDFLDGCVATVDKPMKMYLESVGDKFRAALYAKGE